jgi:hypothetical protein
VNYIVLLLINKGGCKQRNGKKRMAKKRKETENCFCAIIGISIIIANTGDNINIYETNNTVKINTHVTNVTKYEVSQQTSNSVEWFYRCDYESCLQSRRIRCTHNYVVTDFNNTLRIQQIESAGLQPTYSC